MKSGWIGNRRLQALVKAQAAILVPEVVELEDSHVKDIKDDWEAGTDSGGTPLYLNSGGATITATTTTLVAEVANDGATLTLLKDVPTFNAVMVTWSGTKPEEIELHNMVARLDPRADGGVAKNVSVWEAQLFRVTRILTGGIEEGGFTVAPISRPVRVDAAGEAPADFTFNFEALGGGGYPKVGLPPTGAVLTDANPRTLVRIIALQADGSRATNVAWMANSGQSSDSGGGYVSESVSVLRLASAQQEEIGGNAYKLATGAAYPEFTLGQSEYAETTILFDGANEVPDLSGTGDLVIVARGETPSDSEITYEISDDGSTWAECFDGDVIGEDNEGGGDLSGVSTTGPWDIRVTLTPSTAADLNAPTVREFGIERVVSTILREAEFSGGDMAVDAVTLKGNVAAAELRIPKLGENDYRDYGSKILSGAHIGEITVRIWVADRDGSQLNRSEWMLHSAWDVDDYVSTDTHHIVGLISPLRRIHQTIIPPFVVTSGNNGTRTATPISGTLKEAYEEIMDTMLAVAGRFRGPGIEDDTNTVAKTLVRSHGKEELDRLAYLDGSAVVVIQGRICAVKVVRDGPGGDTPVAYFPHGSYTANEFGPGYSTRTDEFFVRYGWNEAAEFFEDEKRYVNAVAFTKLGGVGVNTTQELDEETCKWITGDTLADLVGKRVPHHFATGQIIWPIRSHEWHPELTIGDTVVIETTRFVGRSPLADEEIRGRVAALAVVVGVNDPWGRDLELWVPSFDKIIPATGTVTRDGFNPFADTQTIYFHGIAARPTDDTVPVDVSNGDLRNRTAGSNSYMIPVTLPPGVVMTGISANMHRADTNGSVSASLYFDREAGDTVTNLALATVTHTGTDWNTETAAIVSGGTVISSASYRFLITIDNDSGAAADDRLLWCSITYTRSSLAQRI